MYGGIRYDLLRCDIRFERVADHATNIAYALLEQAPDDDED